MRLSPSDLQLVKTRPQQTELFLSVFQPRIVMKARVNNVNIVKGARTIAFDTVTFGSDLVVEAGNDLWVGSSDGAKDVGRVRIKSITPTSMEVAENSEINWADNQYLTVYRFWQVLPVYPRIIQNPSDEEDVIFYKDYDVAYTNQNSILGSFLNMGSHRAAFAPAQLWYTSSGTYSLQTGTILSYNWAFEGGNPTGSTQSNPGYVSYATPGQYVTRLIVSGSNGAVDKSYRYVSIYNPINSGTNLPYQRWKLDSLDGSRDEGGYSASITIYESSEPIEEGSVVVLFSKDFYGNTERSLGGNQENNSGIFFVGYVLDGSVEYDYEKSTVKFELGSITNYMKQMDGFSVSVESHPSPGKWYQLLDLDINNAIYHYLKWQSTVLSTTDVGRSDNNPKIQYFDADRTSLFDAIDNLVRSAVVGKAVADRQGKIWLERDLTIQPTGSIRSIMDITSNDWRDSPSFDENMIQKLSYLEMGGINFSGAYTGTFQALMANAPGGTPSYRGGVERTQGLALDSQSDLNSIVQNLYAFKNNRIAQIDMNLAGAYRNLDIAPQEPVNVTINPSDTVRGVNVRNDFNINSMSWEYDPETKMLLPNTGLIPWVNGRHVEVINIPATPNEGGYAIPPIQVPNIPDMTFPAGLNFPSSTGSSCCDQLALANLNPYSIRLTRDAPFIMTDIPVINFEIISFDFASNSRIYDPITYLSALQNSGTPTSLTFDVSVVLTVGNNDHLGGGGWTLSVDLMDNSGTSLTSNVGWSLVSIPESSNGGTFVVQKRVGIDFSTLADWIYNKKIKFGAISGVVPTHHFAVTMSDLVITVTVIP